jgi:hypothetical protein
MPVPLGPLAPLRELRNLDMRAHRSTRMAPSKTPPPSRAGPGLAGKENKTPSATASAPTPGSGASMRRRMLKDDLVELLSTARLADLQAELKAISPATGQGSARRRSEQKTPAAATPARGGVRNEARSTGTHAAAVPQSGPASSRAATPPPESSEASVVPSDLFRCTPASAGSQDTLQLSSGGARPEESWSVSPLTASTVPVTVRARILPLSPPAVPATACARDVSQEPAAAECIQADGSCREEVSPLALVQNEINRKREALFGQGLKRSRRSSVIKVLGCAVASRAGSRPNSQPGSRRESLAENERRRTQEVFSI